MTELDIADVRSARAPEAGEQDARWSDPVTVLYTNWRGETAVRTLVFNQRPVLLFGSDRWHPAPQWTIPALDTAGGKGWRSYALSGFKAWGKEAVEAALSASRTPHARGDGEEGRGLFRVVFDGPPGPEPGRFVEVEDSNGRSVDAGSWHQRQDGLWELRIGVRPPPSHAELGPRPCDCEPVHGCTCGKPEDAYEVAQWDARAALSQPSPAVQVPSFTPDEAWQDLLDKDDRTSPEEYPDHALISFDELRAYMLAVAPPPPATGSAS